MQNTITIVYIALCAAGLPWWVAQQHLGGRSIPLVLFSCVYAGCAVICGFSLPLDAVTIASALFAVWLAASLTWSDTHKSAFELLNWLAYLMLFTAARTVNPAILALTTFPTAAIFAAIMVYRIIFRPSMHDMDKMFSFGNGNHNGAYMMIQLFVGLWLTFHLSYAFAPFVLLIAAALAMTKCKAAYAGCIAALITIACMAGLWGAVLVIAAPLITYTWLHNPFEKYSTLIKTSLYSRIFLSLDAARLILMRPVTGWGLNSYSKQLPEIDAYVMDSSFARQITDTLAMPVRNNRSHRAHNDHLEIMVELGIPGYAILVYLVSRLSFADPILLGLAVAVAVNALMFFPAREVHTAAPFWVMLAAAGTGASLTPLMLPVPAVILVCCICLAAMLKTIHIFLGQWFSEMAKHKPGIDEAQKLLFIERAIKHDPENGGYLNDAAFYYAKVNPVRAFRLAAKSLFNYDGTRVLHGTYDMFARTLNGAGQDTLMHWAEDNALRLEPGFPPAKTIKDYLAWKNKEVNENNIITLNKPLIKEVRR